ncbi:hypothetical protein VTO58DRAFT_106420 [Aureobasidium pullulans]
MSEKVG